MNPVPDNAVAVVGMALRVPGARTLEAFWHNLRGGVESIARFTADELLAAGVPREEIAHPDHVPAFGVLEDVAGFDAKLFGFAPREAQLLDPQHRLFLECAWEALEHAAQAGDAVTGVYAGVGDNSYFVRNLLPNADLIARVGAYQTSLGNDKDFVPTRVSYKLNLRGPSVSVQTACSTSLVAVHIAAQALLSGECDVAVAGGATVVVDQRHGYRYEHGGIKSPDGHCRAFDVAAAGAVPGSGAAAVVLKRYADAVADGDVVHAVIVGSAINNDGARKVGFTAPSVEGQADVIAEALAVGEVDPATVSYIEAHGTGTPLGDPIEVAALNSVFAGVGTPVGLGSVKTNLGHLDTAAGVVGLIKTVLALRAGELPPSLHFTAPHPELRIEEGPLRVVGQLTPWRGELLRAGVSSFGIGGTNAHVVLQQAPPRAVVPAPRGRQVLPLSAATPAALAASVAALADHLREHPDQPLDQVAYTLQRGRFALAHRIVVSGDSPAEVAAALAVPDDPIEQTGTDRPVVFTFPGQGAQRAGMARELYEREPVFREQVDRAAGVLDVDGVLYPTQPDGRIDRTEHAQPALFVVEHALATLWQSWGVSPSAMLGHSVGELVSACLAGVLTFQDALGLVAARGRFMQAARPGAMLAVPLPEEDLADLLGRRLAMAAVNGPRQCVLSGDVDAVEAAEQSLRERGISSTRLTTSHAFHSPSMDQAAADFATEVARVALRPPRIPFVSNVTGTWITDEQATDPAYWARQLRSTVRFADGLRTVRAGDPVLLEVGPGRVLTALARGAAVASLPTAGDARATLMAAAGRLWCHGAPVDWDALHGGHRPQRTELPTYPFQREQCWVEPPAGGTNVVAVDEVQVHGFRRVGPPTPAAAPAWRTVGEVPDGLGEPADEADLAALLAGTDAGVLVGGPLAARLPSLAHTGSVRVVALVGGALDVTGEPVRPELAALAAWARAGTPGTRLLLDVNQSTPRAVLRAELAAVADQPVVALRGRHRFLPSTEPLAAGAPGRHQGVRYRLLGDPAPVAVFERALTGQGALVVSDGPAYTVAVGSAAAGADEVHHLGDAEELVGPTTVTWSGWPTEALVARVVAAAPGGCRLSVASPQPVPEADAEQRPVYADEIEHELAALAADLLGVAVIEPNASFFELGGHSLLASQLVAKVRAIMGVEVPLRAFVARPTVAGLAELVRAGAEPVEQLPELVPDLAAAAEPFPLTDVQQAYWIGRTGVFELGNVGMHGYEEFDIPDLDVPRLQEALRALIRRHGMLRAVVLPHGEQQVLPEVPDYVIETHDVRELPADEARAVLDRTRARMSHQVFEPDTWPMFELCTTVMPGGLTRLHYSIDGLITDAWAAGIVLRELAHLYQHPDQPLPELELSFRDYVLAERALEDSDAYRTAADYWHQRIPELALAPDLPLARDPRTIDSPRFLRVSGTLDGPVWSRLKAQAGRRGITPTVLLLAAYGEVVATWSKNRRFTLDLPMANRLAVHPQVEQILGDFTSVTLLEVDATRGGTFEQRTHAVRDRLAADLDHRLFNGVRVIRELKRVRGEAAATMPVVFTSLFQNQADQDHLGETVYSIAQTPQIWIDAQVFEVDDALVLDIDAVQGLFPDGLVETMHRATLDLLHWLDADQAHWDAPPPALVPATDLAAWRDYNRTEGPLPDGLLHTPFFAAAARDPQRPAVITQDRTVSYGELAGRARAVAAQLAAHGVGTDELVAVVLPKGWQQCAAVLGVLAAGAAYLPVDPDLPDERVGFLLAHGRVRAVVAAGDAQRFDGLPVIDVDRLPGDAPMPATATAQGDLAYVIFTSGSTGTPKGVMITHGAALNTVVDMNERFGVGADDRVLALSSLSFDLSVYDVFGPLAVGGAVVMPDPGAHRDPAAWLRLMTEAGVTVWNSVPALMELLVEDLSVREQVATALRLVLLSGDWIPVNLPARIRQVLGRPQLVSLGGATEASIWSILHPIGEVPQDWTSIPYGRPMRNQTFHVLDEALRPRPTGVPGQLYIGGVGVAAGYLHDRERTAASFVVHPETGERLYRTGDLGRLLPGGEIEFLGREDFQVKVAGYRIELGEVEAVLTGHPSVRAAVVTVHGDPRGAKRLVAFVVAEGEPTPAELAEFLAGKLPAYMVPSTFVAIDAVPLTANGKVDRRALVVPEQCDGDGEHGYLAPRTPLEELVAQVWMSMLNLERVGVHDNFFELGGDSLMAMRAVVHLRKELDTDVPITVLFESPTVEGAALVIEDVLLAEIEGMTDEQAQALLSN